MNLSNSAQENKLNLIKTEPEADSLNEIVSDLGDDYDYADSPAVEFNEGLEVDDFLEEMMDTNNDINMMPTTPGQEPFASPPRKLESGKEEKSPRKRGRTRKNPPVELIKEEQAEFLSLSSEQNGNLNPIIKEENSVDGTRKARSTAQTAVKRIADVKKLSRASFQYQPRKVAKKTEQVKTKRNSTRALKTGKIFKTPKQGGKKSTSKKVAQRIKKHFHCEICPYKTAYNFEFEHHLTRHESPEVVNHICPHCIHPPRQFSQKQSFDYHMNSHSGLNKMMCDICSKFIDPFSIQEHLRGHPEAEKIFQCCCCSYYCGMRKSYLNHTRCHASDALICDVCGKKFRRRQTMLEHMHDEHNLLEKVKCDVENCGMEFFERWTLLGHKRRHSTSFPCPECNVEFPTPRLLLGHQVRDHSMEKPFPCSECPETFFDKVGLQNHAIRSHGAAKLKCPYCPKEFATHDSLNSHINLHDGISFPCDQCDKIFERRRHLKRHQEVHRTTKDFVCEECGKAFRRPEKLRVHRKIHVGDKKHKCSYCSKGFVDRGNLIVHERIHTGEKPYVCEACGKDFNQRGPLNQHMKTQHKELLIAIENKSEVTATGSTSTSSSTLDKFNVG